MSVKFNYKTPERDYVNNAQRIKIPHIDFPKDIFTLYLSHPFESRHYIREWELEFEAKHEKIALLNPFYDVAGEGRDDVKARDDNKKYKKDNGYNWRLVQRDLIAVAFARGIVGIVDENSGESFGTKMEFVYGRVLACNPKLLICMHKKFEHPWFQTHFHKIYRSFEEFDDDVENRVKRVKREWGF